MIKACETCGKEFNARHMASRFCSRHCMGVHQCHLKPPRPLLSNKDCPICGCVFHPRESGQTYCSRSCKGKARGGEYQCQTCGKTYIRFQGINAHFCSLQCKDQAHIRICRVCGKQFTATRMQERLCSDACRLQADHEWLWANHPKCVHTVQCAECGATHINGYGDKHKRFCSSACEHRHNGRIAKGRRRTKVTGAERINPLSVFAKAAWRCELCGVSTPRRLRGKQVDRSPELDHIIPLAIGGKHAWDNVQCLCRKCNGEKGATTVGQARFFSVVVI